MVRRSVRMGAVLLLFLLHASPASQSPQPQHSGSVNLPQVPEGIIAMEEKVGRVSFSGVVARDSGEVTFLISTQGYPWVEEESAILSDVRLNDLQVALAMMNQSLFDEVWLGKDEGAGIEVFVSWDGEVQSARTLVESDEHLDSARLIFFGSPYFDHIALEGGVSDCAGCPLFPLEQRAMREQFVRKSGKAGYRLSVLMPPKGTKVLIILVIAR